MVLKGHSEESLLGCYQVECYDTRLDIIKGSHFLVPDRKLFNKLFGEGVKYIVMAPQYMLIGTYFEGDKDKMFNGFGRIFELKE